MTITTTNHQTHAAPPTALPWQIAEIIAQLGGLGLRGAIVYTGGRHVTYAVCPDDAPCPTSTIAADGRVAFATGVQWTVNGKPGRRWHMIVALEPSDTYTVRLWQGPQQRGAPGVVLDEHRDVYCDELQAVVEATYDAAIREHCGGWVPLA